MRIQLYQFVGTGIDIIIIQNYRCKILLVGTCIAESSNLFMHVFFIYCCVNCDVHVIV